jgi:hypothetical protein
MYLAVKIWQDMADKPDGMPDAWPAEVKELGASRTLPDGPWQLMTYADYLTYKGVRQATYAAWLASLPVEE